MTPSLNTELPIYGASRHDPAISDKNSFHYMNKNCAVCQESIGSRVHNDKCYSTYSCIDQGKKVFVLE